MERNDIELIPKSYREDVEEIIKRCEKSDIEYGFIRYDMEGDKYNDLVLKLPRGRNNGNVLIEDIEDAKRIGSIDFEKYVFLEGYEGICSYDDGTIEAMVRPLRNLSYDELMRRLLNLSYREFKKLEKKRRNY